MHQNGGFEELYDLQADPDERQNRGNDPMLAAVRARLRRRLADWLADNGGPGVLDDGGQIRTEPYHDGLAAAEPLARTPLGMRPY